MLLHHGNAGNDRLRESAPLRDCPSCQRPCHCAGRVGAEFTFETICPPIKLSFSCLAYYCHGCQSYFQVNLPGGNNPPTVA